MRVENVKKKKIDLTKFLKNVEEFKRMIETVEKNFEKNFEIKKENSDQIEKLKKDQRNAQNNSKNAAESIDDENEILKNNIMIINFNYNVVEDAVVVVKIENKTLQNIILKQNFRNEYMRKNTFDENTKFSIK